MKHILFITNTTQTGAPIALLQLVRAIKAQQPDWEMTFLDIDSGPMREDFSKYGLCLRMNRLVKGLIFIASYIISFLPTGNRLFFDAIYANTIVSAKWGARMKRALKVPYFLHIHESFYLHIFQVKPEHVVCADEVFAVSELCMKSIIDYYGLSPSRITVQNPLTPFAEVLSKQTAPVKECRTMVSTSSPTKEFTIGLSGTGFLMKSIDLLPALIRAYFSLYPSDECRFVIVGKQDEKFIPYFKYDLQQSDIKDKLTLTGSVKNPIDYYRSFDMALMISRSDSFPLVCQEFALLGKPIVSFEGVIGANEWMEGAGLMTVPYLDVLGVCKAIHQLYDNQEERMSRGLSLRQRAIRLYEENQYMPQIMHVLEKYLK